MKYSLFTLFFTAVTLIAISQKGTFVRVFDEAGKKTHKGIIEKVGDSILTISSDNQKINIPVSQITTLKLKRSFGHTLGLSTLIGAVSFAVIVAAGADPDAWILGYTVAQGVVIGLATGTIAGVTIGSIISGTKNRPVFKINGSMDNWNLVKKNLASYQVIAE